MDSIAGRVSSGRALAEIRRRCEAMGSTSCNVGVGVSSVANCDDVEDDVDDDVDDDDDEDAEDDGVDVDDEEDIAAERIWGGSRDTPGMYAAME